MNLHAAKPVLAIAGTAIGMVGLGTLVLAKLFAWAADQYQQTGRCPN